VVRVVGRRRRNGRCFVAAYRLDARRLIHPWRFAVRFLYVAIGFLMRNLWVWLHYAVLSSPHRGCRRYNLDRLTLRTMLLWLQEVAFSMYELVKIALCERSVPERLTC
jgi:hypothetical protein